MANGFGIGPARRRRADELTTEDIEAIAEQEGPGILQALGEVLSFPGDVARGGARALLTSDPFQLTTARELLRSIGLEPEAEFSLTEPTAAGTAAGLGVLATDIATDPLSLLAGIGQLGRGSKALRGAQQSLRVGRRVRKGGREAVEDIFEDIPTALRPEAKQLGAQRRLTPEEIEAAGGFPRATDVGPRRRAPIEEIGTGRRVSQEATGRARELFGQAEAAGTTRPGGVRGLFAETASTADRPRGFEDILTVGEGFKAPVGAPGARDLLQVGLPGGPKVRVPLPRALERAVGGAAAFVGAPVGRALQRVFGRTGLVKDELRIAEQFFAKKSQNVAGLQERAIQARSEELVAKRIIDRGGGPEDLFDEVKKEFNTDIRNAREGAISLKSDIEQEFADSLTKMVDARTFAQQRRGARGDALLEEYAERLLTTEARNLLRDRDLLDPYREFIRDRFEQHTAIQEGSQIARNDYLPQLTTDANRWFQEQGLLNEGEDFFNLNAAETVSQTIRQRSLSTMHANLAESFVDDVANITGRAGDVTLPQFLARMKMTRYRGAQWEKGAPATGAGFSRGKKVKKTSIEQSLIDAGLDPDVTLPLEAAREFESVIGSGFSRVQPKALNDFLKNIYDPLNSVYRVAVTAPFPAFHLRNMLSNSILNFMGGVRDAASYKEAAKVLASTNEALAKRSGVAFDQVLRDELTELGVLQGGQLQRILDEAAERGSDLPEGAMASVLNFARNNPVSKKGFEFGQYVEDFSRLAHYISKRKKGATKFEAVTSVNKFLFDYSNKALNGLERGFLNRITFFYRWNRFAIPLVLRTLFEHPNRAAVVLKATTQPGVERPVGVPEFIRESAGVPVGTDPQTGETSFISRFGSPFESLEFFDPTGAQEPGVVGGLQKLGREFAQQLVPPLRIVLETIAGEEFFLGRKISELDKVPAIQALLGEATGLPFIGEEVPRRAGGTRFRGSPEGRFAIRNLPTSRVTQTLARLLERPATAIGEATGLFEPGSARTGQRTIPQELLRSVAGVSISEVDTAQEAKRQAQRTTGRLLDQLRLEGEVGRLPVFTATQKGKQSERAQELLKQIRDVNRFAPNPRGSLPAGQR